MTEREAEKGLALMNKEGILHVLGECSRSVNERDHLLNAIKEHHSQKADDRCWMDDDKLYEAAGLSPVDRRVGDKAEMLRNCERFLERRCESGGPWKSYAELEEENERLRSLLNDLWEYATGGPLESMTEERAAAESETMQKLYKRAKAVMG